MSSTQEFNETQLGAARATAWKQTGEPLLTLDAARDFVNEYGLVLFAPRAQQLPAPAPSLVEATLGAANAAPSLKETEVARGLVARLVGEGLALPLNLMGVPGDTPDFVVSAQVFSYIFTMRGDKAWKQAPSTSGAVKVSPLGLRVYEVLTERGAMTAPELAQELGREVTEAAIVRSLNELWSQLRVLPLLSQGDGTTLWELTTRRFTKAIKSGANAGQPTALSALVSLYLAQAFAATEEEIATFLSPLTARSRVREVLHALVGARQLETVVLEGKTLLHIPGGLPVAAAAEAEPGAEGEEPVVAVEKPKKIGTGRIQSFKSEGKDAAAFRGKPVERTFAKPAGRGFVKPAGRSFEKPAGRGFAARSAGAGPVKPSARFGARLDGKSDKERRPFKKDGAGFGARGSEEKKSFSKPWEEDRKPRAASAAKADGFAKFRRPAKEDRAPLGEREQAGLPVERRSPPRERATRSFEKRPYAPRTEASGERSTFKPRSYEGKDRAVKTGGFGAKRPFVKRDAEGGAKPFAKRPHTPRTSEGGSKPFAKGPFAKKPYAPRAAEGEERAAFKPRSYEGKPKFDRASKPGGFGAKHPYKAREDGAKPFAKRPYTPRAAESGAAESGEGRTMPKRPFKPRAADADKRVFTKKPWTPSESEGGKRPYKPRTEGGFGRAGGGARKSFGSKPAGKFGGKPGFAGKPKFGSKPGGFGAKRSGPAGGAKRKKPEAEE
ncbi:MAG: hypothetical protein WBY53_19670 [Acidobacteriaceae bacterium]